MKITISKSQWEGIGKKAGWMKEAVTYKGSLCPKCKCPEHSILSPSHPTINECTKCKYQWNPDNEKANIVEAKKIGKAVNPWAICTKSVGRDDKEKYEKCVMDIKKKHKIKKD
jgi:Zn-finger nucleic acid-binding protein